MADIALRLGKDVLVTQGPMGTQLVAQGFDYDTPLPLLNLTEPEAVEELHRLYRAAGADCAITNTFMATSGNLARHGLAGEVARINEAGVRIARAQGFPHVLASVGPCGVAVEPGSGLAVLRGAEADASDEARTAGEWPAGYGAAVELYAEQIAALAAGDPDALLLETFTSLDDALAAVDAAKRTCDLPVIVSMVFPEGAAGCVGRGGESGATAAEKAARTSAGCGGESGAEAQANGTIPACATPEEAARALAQAGAAAVGCNCMSVDACVNVIERMRGACNLPLIARPSAGIPVKLPDGSLRWPPGPDDFAAASVRLLRAGARILGCCCGGTPAATGAIYAAVGGLQLG